MDFKYLFLISLTSYIGSLIANFAHYIEETNNKKKSLLLKIGPKKYWFQFFVNPLCIMFFVLVYALSINEKLNIFHVFYFGISCRFSTKGIASLKPLIGKIG